MAGGRGTEGYNHKHNHETTRTLLKRFHKLGGGSPEQPDRPIHHVLSVMDKPEDDA